MLQLLVMACLILSFVKPELVVKRKPGETPEEYNKRRITVVVLLTISFICTVIVAII
jgi:hypothetical protein